jgi:hypothetical protein
MTDEPDQERRRPVRICQDQIEEIANLAAERAAEKAVDLIKQDAYQSVGKLVIDKFLWMIGVIVMGVYFWAENKDFFNLSK